jgi:nitroreductase
MELTDALSARRMVRSFDGSAVDLELIEPLCREALRAPTAGNAAGTSFVVMGHQDVSDYFAVATDPTWRDNAPRSTGLLRAGAVVAALCHPPTYLRRYDEPDKRRSALADRERWTVPYWYTDAAMATMALLLLIEEAGLQATLWGNFRHHEAVLEFLGAPADSCLFGTVLIGRSDGNDRKSASLDRDVATRSERVRRLQRH